MVMIYAGIILGFLGVFLYLFHYRPGNEPAYVPNFATPRGALDVARRLLDEYQACQASLLSMHTEFHRLAIAGIRTGEGLCFEPINLKAADFSSSFQFRGQMNRGYEEGDTAELIDLCRTLHDEIMAMRAEAAVIAPHTRRRREFVARYDVQIRPFLELPPPFAATLELPRQLVTV